MTRQHAKTIVVLFMSMLVVFGMCATAMMAGTGVAVSASNETATTTTAVACYATQLDYDRSTLKVGETRAIRFYHPVTQTATGASISEVSDLLSYTYEEGSNTVYVTALSAGDARLYILADGCAFGTYVNLQVLGSDVSLGDLNGDDTTNMMDALLYAKVSGGESLAETLVSLADMNGDGKINMLDALLLYNQVSGQSMH